MARSVVCLLILGMMAVSPAGAVRAAAGESPGKAPAAESGACTCVAARMTNGWCSLHEVGYVGSVRIRSSILYETLDAHGHAVDLSTFTCESCRKAISEEGFCEKDRIGFVDDLAYFSRLTYELARGYLTDPESLDCPVCRKNSETLGWCDADSRGMVGQVAIRDREAWERTAKAVAILREAVKTSERCERCAAAMVTDTQCPYCRITYKDGKPVP